MTEESGGQVTQEVPDKREILNRIRAARAALEAVLAGAPTDRMTAPGPDGWSVKDQLVHLAAWARGLEALLTSRPRHEAMGLDRATWERHEVDEANRQIHEAGRHRTTDEALAEFRASHEAVIAVIERLPAEDLSKPYSHYQPDERPHNPAPVLGWIAGNTWEHDEEHLASIRALLA